MNQLILCFVAMLALSANALAAYTQGGVQEDVLGQLVLVKRTIQITESDCLARLEQPSRSSAVCNVQLMPQREGETLVRSHQSPLAARITLGQDTVTVQGDATSNGYMIIFVSENGRDLGPSKAREALRAALRLQLPSGQYVVYVHTVR